MRCHRLRFSIGFVLLLAVFLTNASLTAGSQKPIVIAVGEKVPDFSVQLVHALDIALIELEVHFQRLVGDALELAQVKLLWSVGLMHCIGPPGVGMQVAGHNRRIDYRNLPRSINLASASNDAGEPRNISFGILGP